MIICWLAVKNTSRSMQDGNSVFEIPVDGFDYPMEVVADTVAMSDASRDRIYATV